MKTTRVTGIREAKAQLSQLIRDVQLGREWVITDRGKPVARLVPATAGRGSLADRVRRLEQLGVIERHSGISGALPPALPLAGGRAQQMLAEDRGA